MVVQHELVRRIAENRRLIDDLIKPEVYPAIASPVPAPVALNDMLIADATPVWAVLTGPAAQGEILVAGAAPFTQVWTTVDLLSPTHGDTTPQVVSRGSIIYGDAGPTWNELVIGPATNFLRSDGADIAWSPILVTDLPAHNLLSAQHGDTVIQAATRGSLVYGDATPDWNELVIGALSTHLESDGADVAWQANITMADDTWIGGAGIARIVFDYTPAGDAITFENCTHVGIDNLLEHNGDLDTYLIFSPDYAGFRVGNVDMLQMQELAVGQDNVTINVTGADVDFIAEAVGVADALFVQGSDGQITLGVLGAGFVQSDAGGVLSSAAIIAGDLPAHTHAGAAQGGSLVVGTTDTDATAGSVFFAGVAGAIQQDNANLFWDDGNNRLGIGAATPGYKLTVTDAGVPIFSERSGAETNVTRTAMYVVHKTSGNMADGFGPLILFGIEDDASGLQPIGSLAASRDGADNSGSLQLVSFSGGAVGGTITLRANGNVGIADGTPTEGRLSIINSVADNGAIAYLYRDQATVNQSGFYMHLDNVADDEAAMTIRHDGTGDLLQLFDGAVQVVDVDNTGHMLLNSTTGLTGHTLQVHRALASGSTDNAVVFFTNTAAGDDQSVLWITQYAPAIALDVTIFAAHHAAYFQRDIDAAIHPVVAMVQDHATAATPVLQLQQDDISEGFINFVGSDRGVIGSGTSSLASVRVELGGVIYRLALFLDA